MDVREALYTTRAMRRVKSDPVPDDVQMRILDAAIRAPTGGNTQDWRFVLVDDKDQIAEIGDLYRECIDILFKSIRDGQPINDGVRMSHSSLLAIMGRMAAYTGQAVTWEHAMNSKENLNASAWTLGDRATPQLAMPGTSQLV